jgi:hypothetical protein
MRFNELEVAEQIDNFDRLACAKLNRQTVKSS